MGLMRGQGAVRRTLTYLNKGDIYFSRKAAVVAMQWNPDDKGPANYGLGQFVFWHLAQMEYKNPRTHFITFHKTTPTPWIAAFYRNGEKLTLDCDCRSREEIVEQVKKVLGTSPDNSNWEKKKKIEKLNHGFGPDCSRTCICEVPGQIACPAYEQLPKELTGLYHTRKGAEEEL